MILRDNLKDNQYFEKYIKKEKEAVTFFIDNTKGKDLPAAGLKTFNLTLDLKKRNILIAKYSAGYEVNNLVEEYIGSLDWFEKAYNSTSFYVQLVWVLSIGIMLDIEMEIFFKIVKVVEKDNPNDYLVDFLINYRDKNWKIKNQSFKFNKPYSYLKSVTEAENKEQALVKLTEYLNKIWYKGHSSTGWYNSHNSKHNTYAGYWSFESGAISKILKLEDNALKDTLYYPYEMVHFKE